MAFNDVLNGLVWKGGLIYYEELLKIQLFYFRWINIISRIFLKYQLFIIKNLNFCPLPRFHIKIREKIDKDC